MADTPNRYKPSQEQIDQLCRSRNESEAEARAFLESDTRDAKDMLAYLEYEGRQVPPDDPESPAPTPQEPVKTEIDQVRENLIRRFGSADGGAGTYEQSLRDRRPDPNQPSPNKPEEAPLSTFSVWVQRGALAVAGTLAVWLFEQFHAPVWLVVVTLIVCLVSFLGVRWLERTRKRRILFITFLVVYAALAVSLGFVLRKSEDAPPAVKQVTIAPQKPDWKESDEAKQLSAQILNDIQGLIDEGRVIDVSDYQRGAKAYSVWVEKCSLTLGRIDNQLERFGLDTDYKTSFDKSSNTRRLASDHEDFDRTMLKSDIRISLIELDRIKKTVEIDTRPDADLIRMPLPGTK